MRVLKPSQLTLLHAPLDVHGRTVLVVAVGVMLDFAGKAADQEQTLWQIFPKAPGSTGILDELRPKVRGEWLVLGSAYAPNKKPAPVVAARANVGAAKKELWAIGNRVWDNSVPSEPVPFLEMPLSWENAFGGDGFAANPLGKGASPRKSETGEVHPLPNVELAGKLITSPREKPRPASFGAHDPSWPDRVARAGTYDKRWLETRYPGFPEDFDPTHFNMAAEDQWIEGMHFDPGLRFSFENMHADKTVVQGTLPNMRARLFVTRAGDEKLHDIALRCDTLWFLPHLEKVIVLFRGALDVEDEMLEELVDVMAALEWGDKPKPLSHYAKVRADRLDKQLGALHALRDTDLMPEDMGQPASDVASELEELLVKEGLVRQNLRRQTEKKLAKMRKDLVANGIDPDKHLPPLPPDPPPPRKEELAAVSMEMERQAAELKQQGRKKAADMMKEVEDTCRAKGLDFEALKQKALRDTAGPPKFRARAEIEKLKDMAILSANAGVPIPGVQEKLSDPRLEDKLNTAEQAMKNMYRKAAHWMRPAFEQEGDEQKRLRAAVLDALATDKDLREWDLTGANLSGIDFGGANLEGAFLEAANLEGCSFRGANCEKVVFTRARLVKADLEQVRLVEANLGEANLEHARLGRADLTHAVLYKAKLEDTDLTGARLDQADFAEAVFPRTILAEVKAKETVFSKVDLSGANLQRAVLEHCTFIECTLNKADFSGATLTAAAFIDVQGVDISFERARMNNIRVGRVERGTSFARGNFKGADLTMANLRGADLVGACFHDAILNAADLSVCKLEGADFEGARAIESRFIKADLTNANLCRTDFMNALFTRAILRGARFEDANLFRADAAAAKGDNRTSFRGANVNQVRFVRPQENRG